jgi:hypothetical protein
MIIIIIITIKIIMIRFSSFLLLFRNDINIFTNILLNIYFLFNYLLYLLLIYLLMNYL